MGKIKLTGKYQLLWEGKDILADVESTGSTVSECWRDGVEGFTSEIEKDISDKKIEKDLSVSVSVIDVQAAKIV